MPPTALPPARSVVSGISTDTALESRNSDDVIADLKRLRPFPLAPKKAHQTSLHHVPAKFDLANVQEQSNGAGANSHPGDLEAHDDEERDQDEDEDDEDILSSTKPRKISERKRRMNAIADSFIAEMAQKSLNEDTKTNHHINEDQSARYIVNQAESQKIISTPREYQTELFERAKEKNIIAVLETGKQMQTFNEVRLTFQALVKH